MPSKANPIDVEHYLESEHFPSSKATLVESARQKHAPDSIIEALDSIPERQYRDPADAARETYSPEPYQRTSYGSESCED